MSVNPNSYSTDYYFDYDSFKNMKLHKPVVKETSSSSIDFVSSNIQNTFDDKLNRIERSLSRDAFK